MACTGEAEVPFGQSELRFFGVAVDVGNACCFDGGGWPNGMVHLLFGAVSSFGAFANTARQG